MRVQWIFLALIVVTLTACGTYVSSATLTPTSAPFPSASSTPDIYKLALGNINAQSTLEAMKSTSQAIEANLTSIAYEPTHQAIGSATAQAWLMVGWTATASIGQTATSASGTATQQSVQATGTQRVLDNTATVDAAAASAKATALHGEAVSVELSIERERMMNNLWAVTPWAALMAGLAVFLFIAWRWSRIRTIRRDVRGDAPLLILNGVVYDADRNPQPLLDVSGKLPAIPALTDPALQAATTARDQMIDLASRGMDPARKQEMARKMATRPEPPPTQPLLNVISAEESRPMLRDVLPEIVRAAVDVDILDNPKKDETA